MNELKKREEECKGRKEENMEGRKSLKELKEKFNAFGIDVSLGTFFIFIH